MEENKITESASLYDGLENLSIGEILQGINTEDQKVAIAIQSKLYEIERLATAAYEKLREGGRMFYIGAGTSGRLGIVDASELPPTYGVPHGLVIGLIAGGDNAIRKAVEFAEDNENGGWEDLKRHNINEKDIVIGIAASGSTPYVWGALKTCREHGIRTGSITCNPGSKVSEYADYPVVIITGPEFVTGSTRMKAGTAQKLVLNMLSTSVMIRLGRVKGNRMVDMQLSNNKLVNRGTRMIMRETGMGEAEARELLERYGSVRAVLDSLK
jgi:N-acetylmuramic acid 6-phosphate etherase